MDAQKLQQANALADRIQRLEGFQRRGTSAPDHAVLSILSPEALSGVQALIDADLQGQLDAARQRFAAL